MCVLIFSNTFLWNVSFYERIEKSSEMCIGLHLKYPLFFMYLKKKSFNFSTDLWKILKHQISWDPSTGSRVIPSWWRDKQRMDRCDRQTDMTKLMVAFCSVVSMPNKSHHDS